MASPNGSSDILIESEREKEKRVSLQDAMETEETGLFYSFFKILFKYGHAILALSFTIGRSVNSDGKIRYFIQNSQAVKRIYSLFYAIVCAYWLIQLIGEKFAVTNFQLINWIKRGTHAVFLAQLIVIKYYLESESSQKFLLTMLREADELQRKFANFNVFFPKKFKVKLVGYFISGGIAVWGITHICIFFTTPDGIGKFTRSFIRASTLNLVDFKLNNLSPTVNNVACLLGTIMETINWSIFYFGDTVIIFAVIAIWIIFQRFTRALKSGVFTEGSVAQVMDLHLSATNLISLMNEILSPLIFWATVYTILCSCFWVNHVLRYAEFTRIHIIMVAFTLKNTFFLLMAADVNTKAHKIAFWLENCCRSNPGCLAKIEPGAMSIWTCQLYNKDSIGFKGLNYFTITSAFISAMLGLIITYSAVVVQFIQPAQPH